MTDKLYAEKTIQAAIDIALNAGALLERNEIEINDSQSFYQNVVIWAEEFKFDEATQDYLTAIDDYSWEKLLAKYGKGVPQGMTTTTYRIVRVKDLSTGEEHYESEYYDTWYLFHVFPLGSGWLPVRQICTYAHNMRISHKFKSIEEARKAILEHRSLDIQDQVIYVERLGSGPNSIKQKEQDSYEEHDH
jgi:hypothetical protein